MYRVIQFNQKVWLKPYIDMNIKLRTEAKNDFEKDFFKLINNAVFGKTVNLKKSFLKSFSAFFFDSVFMSIYVFNQSS